MSPAAAPALRPPRTHPPHTADHALARMSPRPQLPAARATQPAARKHSLDSRHVGVYDHHRVPPPASREPSRSKSQVKTGGLSRVNERVHPPQPSRGHQPPSRRSAASSSRPPASPPPSRPQTSDKHPRVSPVSFVQQTVPEARVRVLRVDH